MDKSCLLLSVLIAISSIKQFTVSTKQLNLKRNYPVFNYELTNEQIEYVVSIISKDNKQRRTEQNGMRKVCK
jgi:hypothetical protein